MGSNRKSMAYFVSFYFKVVETIFCTQQFKSRQWNLRFVLNLRSAKKTADYDACETISRGKQLMIIMIRCSADFQIPEATDVFSSICLGPASSLVLL